MTRNTFITAALLASIATAAVADPLPNYRPGFKSNTGTVIVKNVGGASKSRSIVTVECSTTAAGGCPDPTPAQAAPYQIAGYPNVVAIKTPPLKANGSFAHTIGFFNSLAWTPGTYYFTVCVDAGDHVVEKTNSDNCRRFRKVVKKTGFGGPNSFKSN